MVCFDPVHPLLSFRPCCGLLFNHFLALAPFHYLLSEDQLEPLGTWFPALWKFIITLQIITPLSLVITIELTKILSVWLIHNNLLM